MNASSTESQEAMMWNRRTVEGRKQWTASLTTTTPYPPTRSFSDSAPNKLTTYFCAYSGNWLPPCDQAPCYDPVAL